MPCAAPASFFSYPCPFCLLCLPVTAPPPRLPLACFRGNALPLAARALDARNEGPCRFIASRLMGRFELICRLLVCLLAQLLLACLEGARFPMVSSNVDGSVAGMRPVALANFFIFCFSLTFDVQLSLRMMVATEGTSWTLSSTRHR